MRNLNTQFTHYRHTHCFINIVGMYGQEFGLGNLVDFPTFGMYITNLCQAAFMLTDLGTISAKR